jgi:DNA-binding NtrC family response regulator
MANAKPKILAIDDELGVRESYRMIFKWDTEIVFAETYDAGIEEIAKGGYHAVISDLGSIQGKTGLDAIEAAKQYAPNIPFYLISASHDALRLQAQEAGAGMPNFEMVDKPFDVNDLHAKVLAAATEYMQQ